MNEEALRQLYSLAQGEGYSKSYEDFKVLMSSNESAIDNMFTVAQNEGYKKTKDDFKTLVGFGVQAEEVKKKDEPDMASPSADGSLEPQEAEVVEEEKVEEPSLYKPLLEAETVTIDGFEVTGRDTRQTGYVDPTTGMYDAAFNVAPGAPGAIGRPMTDVEKQMLDRALAQQKADREFTQRLKEAEQPELEKIQKAEADAQIARQKQLQLETEELVASDDFVKALQSTTPEAIQMEEDEAVPYFTDLYSAYGFTFRKVGIGDAMEVTTVGPDGNPKTLTVDLDPFTDRGALTESQALQDFVTKYARKPDDLREEIQVNEIQSAMKARNMRPHSRLNPDGTYSTVLFESAEIDGKNVVYPTLFLKNENVPHSNPDYWMELEGDAAYEEALKRGEVFNFDTKEDAEDFAKGSWKSIHSADAEADKFFREKGFDYISYRKNFDEYEETRDAVDFLERRVFTLDELTPEERAKYGKYYDPTTGQLRNDANQIREKLAEREAELSPLYTDNDFQELRDEFDVYMDKKYQSLAREAAVTNASAVVVKEKLEEQAESVFGLTIEQLAKYTPEDDTQAKQRDAILTSYQDAQAVSQLAANKYEVADTFLSSKYDENLRGEIVDNWAGITNSWNEGWYRGKAGNEILKMSLGLVDVDDDATTAEIARKIVAYMEASNTGQTSRVLNRWHSAKGFREAWDAFSDNPAELSVALAANSFSQMMPYGTKIIGATTATGVGVGAAAGLAGGPLAPVTVTGGALAGLGYGLRTGFAATNLALEYTNEWMEAARLEGFDTTNPQSMELAFSNENVWARAKERGFKRGIPIAVVDFLTSGLAGRVFTTGKTASMGTRIALQTAERVVYDPLGEMTGEILAQATVGDELDWKEVFAEGLGSIGSNAPTAAVNMALDMRAKNNVDIANTLTTIDGLNRELRGFAAPSETRVSNWANNMERLGQINKETNQRIQLNLGLRRDAQNALDATQGKASNEVVQRTMELMAAKEELSSTTNRKEIFRNKIADINAELQELVETKTLRSTEDQTNLAGVGVFGQTTGTDVRPDVRAEYSIDDRKMNRKQFLSRISDMSVNQFLNTTIRITNDEEVSDIVKNKFSEDAIQESETRGVFTSEQTGDIQTVEGEVREVQEEQTTEPTTTPQVEVIKGDRLATNQPITINYNRNPERAPDMGEQFGQDVEAAGTYVTQKEADFTPEGFETGTVQINNPLVIDVTADTQIEYKRKLSAENEGKTGVELTNALKAKGFDAIVTKNEDGTTGEIVLLNDISTYKVEQPTPVAVETTEEVTIAEPVKATRADVAAFDNKTIEPTRLEGLLVAVADKVVNKKKLTKFQERLNEANKEKVDELVSLKTQQQEAAVAVEQEAADLEAVLTQPKGKVDFRLKDELTKEGRGNVEEITATMTAMGENAVIDIDAVEETMPESPKIDMEELNSRLDNPLPTVEWKVIDGVPVIFNISDQLRTGDIVNPLTGTTIDNLKGGLGFNGIEGHQNIAWASVTEDKVKAQQTAARQVYVDNKEFFDNWWSNNPEYNGLVPMVIVKMESSSILSNEAVVRVLADNLKSFPQENKVAALEAFKERILSQREKALKIVETGKLQSGKDAKTSTIKQAETTVAKIDDVISMMEAINATSIDQLVTPQALENLKGITSVNIITENIAYGRTNSPAAAKASPGVPKTPVAVALLGSNPSVEERSKLNLGVITDLITEPQLEKTPTRSAFMITGIDVLTPDIVKTTHPNYPVGPKGKVIGVVEQPQSIVELFPSAYNNVALGIEAEVLPETDVEGREVKGRKRKRSAKQRLMETVPVQMGLNNTEFIGTRYGIDNVGRFLNFINRSMPFVSISTDQETMNRLLESEAITPYLKEGQVVYGMTQDGKIFINAEVHNSENELFNTAVHEMGHIWTESLKLTPKGRKIYNKGAELVKQTKTYEKFLKKFDGDVTKAVDETMATLIGNKGESVVEASLKQKIKDWIASVWSYVKTQFKLSKDLTVEEIQDLTLDKFLETAVADIFAGKPIKMTDKQLKTLTNQLSDSLFRVDDSINEIVRIGRNNGFSDASIRAVLRGRGFSAVDVDAAMEFEMQYELPREFSRIEGGIGLANQLMLDIQNKLDKFAGKRRRSKSYAEIRQKAQELLEAHPTYKAQDDQVQLELKVGLDRVIGYRGNRNVAREMARIRESLRNRKIGAKNLKNAQLALRNYIRAALPKSKTYTQAQINSLIKAVNETTVDNFRAQTEKVLKIVDKQKAKMKREVIREIYKTVKVKATPRKQSGKPRAKGIDATGQVIFKNIKEVMDAVLINDPEARAQKLESIAKKLEANRAIIDSAIRKNLADEEITLEEESLIQLQAAYDQFADLENATLEEAQALLEDVKREKRESILRFNNRRLERAEENTRVEEEANAQIQETNPLLFNEDGSVKDSDELNAMASELKKDYTAKGIKTKVIDVLTKTLLGRKKGPVTTFKNTLTNLGTITNFLDRDGSGNTLFTDKLYRKINRMTEVSLQNIRTMKRTIDKFAEESGFENGYDGVEAAVNKALGTNKVGTPNTKTLRVINKNGRPYNQTFNGNQLLRIYALSKNDVQRAKLERQGITDQVLADIETDLGPELISFADKMIEYLSTTSFDEVNKTYKQVNNVNLGFVENYFPTKTISGKVNSDLLKNGDFNGIFSAETAPAFKDRTDLISPINLTEATFTGALMNHLETMERYKAMAPGVQEMNAFFNIPSVDALLETSGLKRTVKTILNADINPQSAANNNGVPAGLLEGFQRRFTSFALAFKAIQIPKQASSFFNAFENYSYFKEDSKIPRIIRRRLDLMFFAVDAAGVLFGMAKDLVGKNGAIAKAREMSATFDQRVREGLEGDVYGLESGNQTFKQVGKGSSLYERAKRNFVKLSARPTIIGDIMGVMGYYINYKRNIANGMSEARALEEFNNYNATQQARRASDKIPLQLQGDGWSKGFTMFGSTLFLQINKAMSSATNMMRSIGRGEFPSTKDWRGFYINFAVANMLFVGVSNIALLLKGDDEDKDEFMKKMKEAMMGLNLFYQIPYVGGAIEYARNQYTGNRRPVDDVVNPVKSIWQKINRNLKDNPDNAFKAYLLPIFEIAIGAQVDPFIGMYNAIQEGVFGDTSSEEFYENIYDFLGITPSYRPGYGQRGPNLEGIIPQGGIRTKTDLKRYDPDLYDKKYGRQDEIRKKQKERRAEELRKRGYVERNGKLYKID